MPRIDFALTPAQRADARSALRVLDGTGMTLEEAARKAIHGRRALRRVTVDQAADEFLRTRLELRPRTVEWYESKLGHLRGAFGRRQVDDITRADLLGWLDSLECSAGQRAALARAARGLWLWCLAVEPPLVSADATVGFKTTGPSHRGEAPFLTVPQVAAILGSLGDYVNAGALLFFGGLRPEEVAGRAKPPLLYGHVREEERIIRMPPDIAKTGKPRIVDGLPDTLWHWFRRPPGARDSDPIAPGRTRQLNERAQAAIAPRPWPHDATRHTFCTYALAFTLDPGKVSFWSGHEGNPALLNRTYRGLATQAEGRAYFALRRPA